MGKKRYRMEVNLNGKLIHNGSGNIVMKSKNIDPIIIEGDDIEGIFVLLKEMQEYIHGEKNFKSSFFICLS